jgi:hypothetical protein
LRKNEQADNNADFTKSWPMMCDDPANESMGENYKHHQKVAQPKHGDLIPVATLKV